MLAESRSPHGSLATLRAFAAALRERGAVLSRHMGRLQLRFRVNFYCQAGRKRDCPGLASALMYEKVAA